MIKATNVKTKIQQLRETKNKDNHYLADQLEWECNPNDCFISFDFSGVGVVILEDDKPFDLDEVKSQLIHAIEEAGFGVYLSILK